MSFENTEWLRVTIRATVTTEEEIGGAPVTSTATTDEDVLCDLSDPYGTLREHWWRLAQETIQGMSGVQAINLTDGGGPNWLRKSTQALLIREGHPVPFKVRWEEVVMPLVGPELSRTAKEVQIDPSEADDSFIIPVPPDDTIVFIENLVVVTPIVSSW